jgi:hypothetical protein
MSQNYFGGNRWASERECLALLASLTHLAGHLRALGAGGELQRAASDFSLRVRDALASAEEHGLSGCAAFMWRGAGGAFDQALDVLSMLGGSGGCGDDGCDECAHALSVARRLAAAR